MTENFLFNYFALPFLISALCVIVFKSVILKIGEWEDSTKRKRKSHIAGKKLKKKAMHIRQREL